MNVEFAEVPQDKTTVEFLSDKKDSWTQESGFPDEVKLSALVNGIPGRMIDLRSLSAVLDDRYKSEPGIARRLLNDVSREGFPRFQLKGLKKDLVQVSPIDKEYMAKFRTGSLVRWRNALTGYMQSTGVLEEPLEQLDALGLTQGSSDLLAKYGKDKLFSLLQPDSEIEEGDLRDLVRAIEDGFKYRNRKISEAVRLEYASGVSTEANIGQVIKDLHILAQCPEDMADSGEMPDWNNYRTEDINKPKGFSGALLPHAMSHFEKAIESTEKFDDVNQAQREALKYYILFEMLHPFGEGNGRTGRALFVYLQRRFLKNSETYTPVRVPETRHIPNIRNRDAEKTLEKGSTAGLAFEKGKAFDKIVHAQELSSLWDRQPHVFDADTVTERQELVDTYLDKVIQHFTSGEVAGQVNDLLTIIQQMSPKDSVISKDKVTI